MIVFDSVCKIIKYEILPQEYKDNLCAFYETNGKEFIIDLGENRYSTYQQMENEIEPSDIRVAYDSDMFMNGRQVCEQFGYAIAEDGDKNGSIQSYIMDNKSGNVNLTWPNGIYNKAVTEYNWE